MRHFHRLLFVLALAYTSGGHASEDATTHYPLDTLSRAVVEGEKLACQAGEIELVTYRGQTLRYQKPLRIHPAFRSQLAAFELLVDEVARAHFGRAPRAIRHFGAYACRPMRNHAHWASEHAFGNAIDVAGFEFGPLPRKSPLFATTARAQRRAFQVRVDRHWSQGESSPEGAFLADLAGRIIARPDMFRALVGPGWPGHDNHFHLAHPPYRMVKLGPLQRWFW